MENEGYPKLQGSGGSKGVTYQVNLLVAFLLNAVLQNLQRWKLSTENKTTGKFDDVVLETKDGGIFLQAKSRENKDNVITLEQLLAASGDFSLFTYFSSYVKIKNNFNIRNLILCSNAEVNEKVLEFLISHRSPPQSLLHFDRDHYRRFPFYTFSEDFIIKFSETMKVHLERNACDKTVDKKAITDSKNLKEFFEKLQIYPCYLPNSDFKEYIEKLLSLLKYSNNLFCEISVQDVFNNMKEWFEKPGKGEYITESKARAMLCTIKSTKYCEKLKEYDVLFSHNVFKHAKQKQLTRITVKTEYLLELLKVHQALKDESDKVLYAYPDDGEDVQRHIIEAFLEPKYVTLVIVCPIANEESVLEGIRQKLCEILITRSYKKVILITNSGNALAKQIMPINNDNCEIQSCVRFNDFSEDTQKKLKQKRSIHFQGTAVNLDELSMPLTVTEFENFVCPKTLEDLVRDVPISVGSKVEALEEDIQRYYITREFKREEASGTVIYSEKEICSLQEKVILINDCAGMGKTTVLTELATNLKRNFPHLWLIRINLTDCSKTLQGALRNKHESVDIQELLDTPLDTEFKKSLFSMNEKIVLLLDAVDEISPDYTNLIVNLLFQCQKASNFARIFVTTRPHISEKLEKELGVKPFFLVPLSEEIQIKFLSSYWTVNLKLEDKDKKKCRKYAKQLLKKVSPGSYWYQSDDHFAGVPLFLWMLAEIFMQSSKSLKVHDEWVGCKEFVSMNMEKSELPKKMNLSKLYEMFVQKKREVFLDKENPDSKPGTERCLNKQFDECLDYCEVLAVEYIFGENVLQHFTSYKQENCDMQILIKIGIIQESKGEYQFTHQTWAEYFSAKSLVRELRNGNVTLEFKDFLIKYLVRHAGHANEVVEFFDNCLEDVLDSLPSNFFRDYESEKYEIDNATFVQTILIFHNLTIENRISILKFLLNCARDGSTEEVTYKNKKLLLSDFCNVEEENQAVIVYGNLFKIMQQTIKQGGLNIIDEDPFSDFVELLLNIVIGRNHLEMMKLLMTHGANIYLKDSRDYTPLMTAAKHGHLNIVQFLLENEIVVPDEPSLVKAYINAQNVNGETALHIAAYKGYLNIFKFLVQKGADMNVKRENGDAVLHRAASGGSSSIVNFLLEHGIDINVKNREGETCLHKAASKAKPEMFEFLVQKEADMNATMKNGDTVLHRATSGGCFQIVNFLLEHGVAVNIENKEGKTALHKAASEANLKIFMLLIQKGADVNATMKNGDTVLHRATSSGCFHIVNFLVQHGVDINKKNTEGETAVHKAASRDELEIFKLLLEKGADVNVKRNNGDTVLHRAVSGSCYDAVNFLFQHGVEVNVKNGEGETPLHKAASRDEIEIFKLLLEKGADLNAKRNNGDTMLHRAVSGSCYDIVNFLFEQGVEVNVKNTEGETPLHKAAAEHNLNIFKLLVQKGADMNAKRNNGDTLLHRAASKGCSEIINFLLEHGLDFNIENKEGETALHAAARNGDVEIFKLLIQKGADLNAKTKNGHTMLHRATSGGCYNIVKFLLEQGTDVNMENREGETAIHIAAHKDYLNIFKLLVQTGADVHAKRKNGDTVLHRAASGGSPHIVNILLEHGVEVNMENRDSETALHKAASRGNLEIFSLLVQKGADMNAKRKNGDTVLHQAASNGCSNIVGFLLKHKVDVNIKNIACETAVHKAAYAGDQESFELLVQNGADINAKRKNDDTVLHRAASGGCPHIVNFLLKHGIDVNIENEEGTTVLHKAASRGNLELFNLLVEKGADMNAKRKNGDTVLHRAVSGGCFEIVKCLLDHGVDVNIKNSEGETALYTAVVKGSREIYELLLEKGADMNASS